MVVATRARTTMPTIGGMLQTSTPTPVPTSKDIHLNHPIFFVLLQMKGGSFDMPI
jgi:hypothetical protein